MYSHGNWKNKLENGLNFHSIGIIKEENSYSKNILKGIEKISCGDENNINRILERTNIDSEPIFFHEDLINSLRSKEDGLNFYEIIKNSNSNYKNLWRQMEHISHGDENNFNFSPERMNVDFKPILTAKEESIKKNLVKTNIKKISPRDSSLIKACKCAM